MERSTVGTRRGMRGWVIALVIAVVLLVLVTLPPFVGPGARAVLMHIFAPTCHQIPARSPHLHGVSLAVCFRCYGVYWGILTAVLGFLLAVRLDSVLDRYARVVFGIAILPAAVDWSAGLLSFWSSSSEVRFVTGGLFGLAAGYFLTRALVQLFGSR